MKTRQIRSAFTLVELLVSIAIMAILIAIFLPALGSTKFQVKVAKTLSVEHQLLVALSAYAVDFDGYYPYLATPGKPREPIIVRGNVVNSEYFRAQRVLWASVLVPEYYGSASDIDIYSLAGNPKLRPYPEEVVLSRYWLTSSVVAAPGYWRDPDPAAVPDVALLRGIRHSKVVFPSRKGLLLDVNLGVLNPDDRANHNAQDIYAGVADGSARAFNFVNDLVDHDGGVYRPYGGNPFALMTTLDGVAGVDFK